MTPSPSRSPSTSLSRSPASANLLPPPLPPQTLNGNTTITSGDPSVQAWWASTAFLVAGPLLLVLLLVLSAFLLVRWRRRWRKHLLLAAAAAAAATTAAAVESVVSAAVSTTASDAANVDSTATTPADSGAEALTAARRTLPRGQQHAQLITSGGARISAQTFIAVGDAAAAARISDGAECMRPLMRPDALSGTAVGVGASRLAHDGKIDDNKHTLPGGAAILPSTGSLSARLRLAGAGARLSHAGIAVSPFAAVTQQAVDRGALSQRSDASSRVAISVREGAAEQAAGLLSASRPSAPQQTRDMMATASSRLSHKASMMQRRKFSIQNMRRKSLGGSQRSASAEARAPLGSSSSHSMRTSAEAMETASAAGLPSARGGFSVLAELAVNSSHGSCSASRSGSSTKRRSRRSLSHGSSGSSSRRSGGCTDSHSDSSSAAATSLRSGVSGALESSAAPRSPPSMARAVRLAAAAPPALGGAVAPAPLVRASARSPERSKVIRFLATEPPALLYAGHGLRLARLQVGASPTSGGGAGAGRRYSLLSPGLRTPAMTADYAMKAFAPTRVRVQIVEPAVSQLSGGGRGSNGETNGEDDPIATSRTAASAFVRRVRVGGASPSAALAGLRLQAVASAAAAAAQRRSDALAAAAAAAATSPAASSPGGGDLVSGTLRALGRMLGFTGASPPPRGVAATMAPLDRRRKAPAMLPADRMHAAAEHGSPVARNSRPLTGSAAAAALGALRPRTPSSVLARPRRPALVPALTQVLASPTQLQTSPHRMPHERVGGDGDSGGAAPIASPRVPGFVSAAWPLHGRDVAVRVTTVLASPPAAAAALQVYRSPALRLPLRKPGTADA